MGHQRQGGGEIPPQLYPPGVWGWAEEQQWRSVHLKWVRTSWQLSSKKFRWQLGLCVFRSFERLSFVDIMVFALTLFASSFHFHFIACSLKVITCWRWALVGLSGGGNPSFVIVIGPGSRNPGIQPISMHKAPLMGIVEERTRCPTWARELQESACCRAL